jgi:hypothetical protein
LEHFWWFSEHFGVGGDAFSGGFDIQITLFPSERSSAFRQRPVSRGV